MPSTEAMAWFWNAYLSDEAVDFGERLAKAGVPVQISVASGMMHGFFGLFEADSTRSPG